MEKRAIGFRQFFPPGKSRGVTTRARVVADAAAANQALYVRAVGLVRAGTSCSTDGLTAALGCAVPLAKELIARMEREGLVTTLPKPHPGCGRKREVIG